MNSVLWRSTIIRDLLKCFFKFLAALINAKSRAVCINRSKRLRYGGGTKDTPTVNQAIYFGVSLKTDPIPAFALNSARHLKL